VRVLVDTSVWADFVNGRSTPETDYLASLIRQEEDIVTCGVVVAEFLQGLRTSKSVARFAEHFRDMLWLSPEEPHSYEQAAAHYRSLRRRGITVRSTIDCLIACLAQANGCALLSSDRDMRFILDSGLVKIPRINELA
jgi:predicted nucleic acid-binding protein